MPEKSEKSAAAAILSANLDDKAVIADPKVHDRLLLDYVLQLTELTAIAPHKDKMEERNFKWTSAGEKNGVVMAHSDTTDCAFRLWRGKLAHIPVSVADAEMFLRDYVHYQRTYDTLAQDVRMARKLDANHSIAHATYNLGMMVTNRDFVWLSSNFNLPDGAFVQIAKSIVSADAKEDSKFVRGEIRIAAFIVQPVKDKENECSISYVTQCDPKGSLPARLVNWLGTSAAYTPGNFRDKVSELRELKKKVDEAAKKADEEAKKKASS